MKMKITPILIPSLFFALSVDAQIIGVNFGADYSGSNINTATPPSQEATGDYNFNGSATDRASFVNLGQEHTAPNSANWTTPEGKSGAVIRYGFSIANIGSSDDPSINLVRYNANQDTLQNTSGAGTAEMRMASAWYWEKSSFLNGADALDNLTFANQADSLSADFVNSGTPSESGSRLARFMVQSAGTWFLSANVFGGTSGTLSIDAAESTWHSFDPLSATLLFYDPDDMGTGVLGSELNDITAIGVHVQHELFDGTSNNAVIHAFDSLEAVVIPEPVTISVLFGLGAFAFVLIRRRSSFARPVAGAACE